MDLEQQLRSLLTDDRLDVPLVPGAVQTIHDGVRRRKRRNAVMSAAASFVLVAGGIATGVVLAQGGGATLSPSPDDQGTTPPPVGGLKPPVKAGVPVAWSPIAYDAGKRFALPGTTPDAAVPSCKADQLSLTASEFQGATGSAAGALIVTNNGDTCGVQGRPLLTGFGDGDTAIATTTADDAFVVHPWVALKQGQQARTYVQIFGDAARCDLGPVKRLTVDLGQAGGSLSTDVVWAGGGDVKPRCGTVPKGEQVDHYSASPGEWIRRDGTPRLPMSDFSAAIGDQPTAVMQGTTVRYQVLLSTGVADIDPCLPYRQQLVSLDGTQTAYGTSYFLMDCDAINADPAQSYVLDMQLALPKDIPVGSYTLQWQTPIQGVGAADGQTIEVTSSPPMCTSHDLSARAGSTGAATTHYSRVIILRNTSDAICSIRGYPGIQLEDSSGRPQPTKDRRSLSSFMWRLNGYETLRVAPGAEASFALGGVDYDVVHNRSCPTAPTLKVIAPNDVTQLPPVTIDWPYCLGGKVDVSPVVAGARGPH